MLLFFHDPETGIKTVQMIVMTANLIQEDWEYENTFYTPNLFLLAKKNYFYFRYMTQGVYRTPRCPLKSIENRSIQGTLIGSEYGSPFEHELIKYLKAYQLRRIFDIVIKLKLYDWSSCKVNTIEREKKGISIYTSKGYSGRVCSRAP